MLDIVLYANIILNTINGLVTLSARPSDAIAIALRSNIPVTVNEEVFEKPYLDRIRLEDYSIVLILSILFPLAIYQSHVSIWLMFLLSFINTESFKNKYISY